MLKLEPLTTNKLNDFRQLLGSREFGGCFCAVWTSYDEDWGARCKDQSQPNFLVTKKNVEDGHHTGYLVYRDSELIGWTGSGPKTSFPFLETKLGSRLSSFSSDIWSIGCLAVKESHRGQGLSEQIIQAVIKEANRNGAKSLEAYPVRPFHEPRIFRGSCSLYQRLGFTEVGLEKDGEHEILLMQYRLEP